ncbi:hypothetical protein DCAR_0310127 [Daucus carota subsp. sativus]|uniref:Uncharacterized protein n=1 Tax=Daucus carota subsp. sativus TaxID=79200 RepID=A0A165ZM24_DAUCS|nr:PREDICTED: uncharacterized protein LOC108211262 [Daucus carota subsp. sativus]WOG90881.1 hypothetical protein DCAR_0310127 [Daucus carota subsp. sativus]
MVSRIKTSLLVLLVVLSFYLSSGTVDGFSNGAKLINSLRQDGSLRVNLSSRKLLSHDVSDYDEAGANTKHDPRGRRGGGGGKNR